MCVSLSHTNLYTVILILQACRREPPSYLPESPYQRKDHFSDRECDSGYAPDPARTEKMCEREPDAGYGSDRPGLDPEYEASFTSGPPGPRECDSGFGPTYPGKEEPDTFSELCGECDSGCTREAPSDGAGPRDALADSDSGCADLTGKWEDETPCALPGFQQAFGSTEIGRFSRNDFFTNPSPPQNVEPITEQPRKPVRKPRSPRVKQVRRERPDSPKLRATTSTEPRGEGSGLNTCVPMSDGMQCGSRMCGPPYEACGPKYCEDYAPQPSVPPSSYPYARNPAPYGSYPHSDLPYFRPFPFPLACAQTWNEPRWPAYQPTYQQPYQQPYQPQQPWTSANVYPFMRLDY